MTLKTSLEMMEIGSLFIMCSYHLILFIQVKKASYAYLAAICFMVFMRALLVDDGSQIMYDFFPGLTQNWGRTIEYTAAYSTLFLTPLFINSLFPSDRYTKYIKFFTYIGVVLIIIVLFTPYPVFKATLNAVSYTHLTLPTKRIV